MQYVGLHSQIQRNNTNSFLLLITFPALLLAMCYAILFFTGDRDAGQTNQYFLQIIPFVLAGVGIWFLIAWAGHNTFIKLSTGAKSLERKENKRVLHSLINMI